MDLLNATGEPYGWWYDGKRYEFPPGELVRVSDACGQHMLNHLSIKGLQEVRYSDDRDKIALVALRAIVAFHRRQIAVHERHNEVQSEKKFPIFEKPEGVYEAEAALQIYEPILEKREAEAQERARAKKAASIGAALDKGVGLPELDDMTLEELREKAEKAGLQGAGTLNKRSILARLRELQDEKE